MRTSRYVLSLGAAALLLAGCGGSGASSAIPQTGDAQLERGQSWAAPQAVKSDLLYVSDIDELSIYSYPAGSLVGVIKNADFSRLAGECVDASGDIFVASLGNGKIFEYAHGGRKLLNTLEAPAKSSPVGCAVDPTTGNLAVTALPAKGATGSVAIYAHAQGSPQVYTDPRIRSYFFCGYDGNGNLFVDGRSSLEAFRFAELPAGSSSFVDVTLNRRIGIPGSVLVDGKYVTVGDQAAAKAYEFSVKGSAGKLVNTTRLNGLKGLFRDRAFWIQGNQIVVAGTNGRSLGVDFFAYPAGGNATKIVTKDVRYPLGLAVSLAAH